MKITASSCHLAGLPWDLRLPRSGRLGHLPVTPRPPGTPVAWGVTIDSEPMATTECLDQDDLWHPLTAGVQCAAGSPSHPGNSTGRTGSAMPSLAAPAAHPGARPGRGPRRTRTTHLARFVLRWILVATARPTGHRAPLASTGGSGSLPGSRQGTCRRCPRACRILLGAARNNLCGYPNLASLCRQHHQTKQAQGWHLTQPHPGTLTWTAPHGRTYTITPDSYPV